MEKYEPLGVVGEGSYGIVLKCKSRGDGKIVAIKKFIDSEDDLNVRKIAMREIRVLKKLRHENLVNLLEVFRRRKHLYLVFEFIESTLLDQLEQVPNGLDGETSRKFIFQILRGLAFCHDNNIIHRDIKPENVLVSKNGVVKLCDFGFARPLSAPGEIYTDYVATRWYRAPELLVGDPTYGKEVDIWAVGCLFSEMMTGEPLFPGDSDIDQLFLISQCLGRLSDRHIKIMSKNSAFRGFQLPKSRHGSTASTSSFSSHLLNNSKNSQNVPSSQNNVNSESRRRSGSRGVEKIRKSSSRSVFSFLYPSWDEKSVEFLTLCLDPEPNSRPTCNSLLRLPYFTHDNFIPRFIPELNSKLQEEGRQPITAHSVKKRRNFSNNPLPNVTVSNINFTSKTQAPPPPLAQKNNFFTPSHRNSVTEEKFTAFESNNLLNQSHFQTSSNLASSFGDKKLNHFKNRDESLDEAENKKIVSPHQSKIPVFAKNNSNEALPVPIWKNSNQDQTQNAPKERRFSILNSEEVGNFKINKTEGASVPVTNLTFSLGPHVTTYNGNSFLSSNVPAPLKSNLVVKKQRQNPGINSNNTQKLGNNSKNNTNFPWSTQTNNVQSNFTISSNGGENANFLPKVTSKRGGVNFNVDENRKLQQNGTNNFGKRQQSREKTESFSLGSLVNSNYQSRRSSFSSDLGNIKSFLNPQDNNRMEGSSTKNGFPLMMI